MPSSVLCCLLAVCRACPSAVLAHLPRLPVCRAVTLHVTPRWRNNLRAHVERKRIDDRIRELSSQHAQHAGATDNLHSGPLGIGDPLGHWPLKISDLSACLNRFKDKEETLCAIDENLDQIAEHLRPKKRRRALGNSQGRGWSALKGAALEWETSMDREHSESCAPDTWLQAARVAGEGASVGEKGCCPMMHPGLCRTVDEPEMYTGACEFAAAMAHRSAKQKKDSRYRSIFRFKTPAAAQRQVHLWVLQAGGSLKTWDKVEVFQVLRLCGANREDDMGQLCAQPLRDMDFPYKLELVDFEKKFGPSTFTLPTQLFAHELAMELAVFGNCATDWSVEVCGFVPADRGLDVEVQSVVAAFESVKDDDFHLSAAPIRAAQVKQTLENPWSPTVAFLKSVGCVIRPDGKIAPPERAPPPKRAPDVPDDAGSDENSTDIEDKMRHGMLLSSSSSEGETHCKTTLRGKKSAPKSLLQQVRVYTKAKRRAIQSAAAASTIATETRASRGQLVIERWGPVTFSVLKGGGVGAAWDNNSFLQNSFNTSRDGCSCTSGKKDELSQSECLLRVRRWVCKAFEAWAAGGDELKACLKCKARTLTFCVTSAQVRIMRQPGLWTQKELLKCA